MLVVLKIVLDTHEETDEQVGGGDTSEEDQRPLADEGPWRVADAKEDGLVVVSGDAEGGKEEKRLT
jgi:hypothetical protein